MRGTISASSSSSRRAQSAHKSKTSSLSCLALSSAITLYYQQKSTCREEAVCALVQLDGV